MTYHEFNQLIPFTHALAKRLNGKAVRVHAKRHEEPFTIHCGVLEIVDKDTIKVNNTLIPHDAVIRLARQPKN